MTRYKVYDRAEAEATRRAVASGLPWNVIHDLDASRYLVISFGEDTLAYLDAHRSEVAFMIIPLDG